MRGDHCEGVTMGARQCARKARYYYVGRDGESIVRRYCAQHYAGAGPTRMLRPWAWEYSSVIERVGGSWRTVQDGAPMA